MQQLIQGAQMLLYAENQIISKALSWGIRSFWAFSHELPLPFVGCHSTHKSLCQVQLQLSTYPKHTQLIYFRDTNWTYPLNNFAIFLTLQPSWGILTKELPILNSAILEIDISLKVPIANRYHSLTSQHTNNLLEYIKLKNLGTTSGRLLNSLSFSSSLMCLSNLHIHATS